MYMIYVNFVNKKVSIYIFVLIKIRNIYKYHITSIKNYIMRFIRVYTIFSMYPYMVLYQCITYIFILRITHGSLIFVRVLEFITFCIFFDYIVFIPFVWYGKFHMPLDDQLVTMSEKQLWKAFVLQNLNFQFQT